MNKKVICIRIRPKCCWYEYGEISSKFFLNLEKSRAVQSTIWNITKDGRNLACHKELIRTFLTFIKTYCQMILTCPRIKLYIFKI